jgi:hypothetical protein
MGRWLGLLSGMIVMGGLFYFAQTRFNLLDRIPQIGQTGSSFTAKQTQTMWRSLKQTTNGCPDIYDYGSNGGARSFWCHLKTVITEKQLEDLLGEEVFRSGPHVHGEVDLNNGRKFGHYNPNFVTNLSELVLPQRDDELRQHFQSYYDKYLKFRAREYLRAYLFLERNPETKSSALKQYKDQMANPDSNGPLIHDKSWGTGDGETIVFSTAVAFWLRRSMDQTIDEFFAGLSRLFEVFDKDGQAQIKSENFTVEQPDPVAEVKSTGSSGDASTDIKSMIKNIASSKNHCPGLFDYAPYGGLRIYYCHMLGVLDYGGLQKLIPIKIFNKGPHSSTQLRLESKNDFGLYNPDFVRWLIDHGVPAATSDSFRNATQAGWNSHFSIPARVFLNVVYMLERDPQMLKAEMQRYSTYVSNPDSYQGYPPHSIYWEYMPQELDDQGIGGPAMAFWVRRSMDRTLPLFKEGLEKMVGAYDPKMLSQAKSSTMKLKNPKGH